MDPAVGAFLDSLKSAGLSDSQIGNLAQVQGDKAAWNEMYSSYTGGGSKKQSESAADAMAKSSAKALIAETLREYGLESLSSWAMRQIQDNKSPDEVLISLRQRDEYKARFPAMELRRKNGYSAISERDYINYETATKDLFKAYGMPEQFYDGADDIADLLGNKDLGLPELQFRVERGWSKVRNAPAEVRQIFGEWFGPEGDVALAAWFMDDEKAQPILERAVEVGGIGGMARTVNVAMAKARAERVFEAGFTQADVRPRLTEVLTRGALFNETFGEAEDLTVEEEGVDAAFQLDPDAESMLRDRLEERLGAQRGGGGAMVGARGTGFGGAE